jgi:DNA topoisomerase VI subunit B
MTAARKLNRETFRTSRLMDFCSVKELTAQTGHQPAVWPIVALKEMMDNALDACEDAAIDPVVSVRVDDQGITVSDNGPGIPPETVKGVLDFDVRVSSREAYISPTRGAQGNALKTLVMMPFVLDGQEGAVEVLAQGVRHEISVRVDHIRQRPDVSYHQHHNRKVKPGTSVRLYWPVSSRSMLHDAKGKFLQIAQDFTFLNPHLSLSIDWFAERTRIRACKPSWRKWRPGDPTCPWWYEQEHLERLVAACIASDQQQQKDRTVREFLAGFAGLTGTAKQKAVLEATGLSRMKLSALASNSQLDRATIGKLLDAMRSASKRVGPKELGSLGRDFVLARFAALGCEMDSFQYRRVAAFNPEGLPYVLEAAFAWSPNLEERRTIIGINWSPAIVNPIRELGWCHRGLDGLLERQKAGDEQPVVVLLHMASPRVAYTDRGKSAVIIPAAFEEEE